MKIFGNRGQGWKGAQAQGVGIASKGSQFGSYVNVAGAAGEIACLGISQLVPGTYDRDAAIQSSAPVSIEFTLSEESLVSVQDPAINATALWTPPQAVPANDIVILNNGLPFTGVRITFSADTVFTVMAR